MVDWESQGAELVRMVRRMARKYRNTPLGMDDAEGVGLLAIVEAQRTFKPELGVPFIAYAAIRASGDMAAAARDIYGNRTKQNIVVIIPDDELLDGQWHCHDEYSDLSDRILGLRPNLRGVVLLRYAGYTLREIGDHYGVTESRISQLTSVARRQLSV